MMPLIRTNKALRSNDTYMLYGFKYNVIVCVSELDQHLASKQFFLKKEEMESACALKEAELKSKISELNDKISKKKILKKEKTDISSVEDIV